jgi:hypothetical protein
MSIYSVLACSALLVLSAASRCTGTRQTDRSPDVSGVAMPGQSGDTLYHLSLSSPTVEQPLGAEASARGASRFVRIEVVEVTNPARHPLTFEVRYRSNGGAITYLGNFSTYPADNPGTFIVPTQGRVSPGGALLLTLTASGKTGSDPIRAAVRKLSLVDD